MDLSLMKNVAVTERVNVQVRVESFNAFNRATLNAPTTNMTSGNFGKSTSVADARACQVSLRLRF